MSEGIEHRQSSETEKAKPAEQFHDTNEKKSTKMDSSGEGGSTPEHALSPQDVYDNIQLMLRAQLEQMPNIKAEKLFDNKYSDAELQELMQQTKNPRETSLLLQFMAENPRASTVLDSVKKLLNNNDLVLYSAALSFMMKHGDSNDLPLYIKNADEFLGAMQRNEARAKEKYGRDVMEAKERSRKTGRGGKAHLLIERPEDSPTLFFQYSSLIAGYGAALERGRNTIPQMRKMFKGSGHHAVPFLTGAQLISSGRIAAIKDLFTSTQDRTKQNGLLMALDYGMFTNKATDKRLQETREREISTLCGELLSSGMAFDATQILYLEKIRAKQSR